MTEPRHVVRNALRATPVPIVNLAEEAGCSDRLLRMIRDGDRRLTAEIQADLVSGLRRMRAGIDAAIKDLETVDVEPRDTHLGATESDR